MAAAVEVLLLVALISNNIHAEVILRAGKPHDFILKNTADFCLISRWTGEERKVLWNSSKLHDSRMKRGASYHISSLDVSDSGLYQEQCWTQGHVTHERNATVLVCDDRKMRDQRLCLGVGQTEELTCDSAGPNQSVQWALEFPHNHKIKHLESNVIDDVTSSMCKHHLAKNKSSLLATVKIPVGFISYYCLEKNHQRCDLLTRFNVDVSPEIILRSVGQSLELNCSDVSGHKPRVWRLFNSVMYDEVSPNYTLMLPSLTANHTGRYICRYNDFYREFYSLYVCPESVPPAVAFFTEGQNVTLQCGNWTQTRKIHWFMRSHRTGGRVSSVHCYQQRDKRYLSDSSLVVTNVSPEDSGEFWCVIVKKRRCVFSSKTFVMFREPEVDHHLARSVSLSVVVMMMCVVVVVVAVVWRTRSREQLPAPVEELEMTELSPAVRNSGLSSEHDPCE